MNNIDEKYGEITKILRLILKYLKECEKIKSNTDIKEMNTTVINLYTVIKEKK